MGNVAQMPIGKSTIVVNEKEMLVNSMGRKLSKTSFSGKMSIASSEIDAVRNTRAGWSTGPEPGNFGITQVPAPGFDWEPTGADPEVGGAARALNNGRPPLESTVVTLDSFEHISYQYLAPARLGDGSDLLIMSRMLVFITKDHNLDDESTVCIPLHKLNKLSQQQWNDFVRDTTLGTPYFNQEKQRFKECLERLGEHSLEAYAYQRNKGNQEQCDKFAAAARVRGCDLREFYTLSTQQGYCYLTRYGWLSRVSWGGPVVNTNHAESLMQLDDTAQREHYLQINVGYAKRIECAQNFGHNDDIMAGSRLWITLTRKPCPEGKFGAFVLRPGGSKVRDHPALSERCYLDESGHLCRGYVWKVGIVTQGPQQAPSVTAQERANCTDEVQDEGLAYQMHATLPSMWIACGYKH